MTAATPPEEGAAVTSREANHETPARVPGRRSTFRPALGGADAFAAAVATAAGSRFPDAPLVQVVEQTADGRQVSEGFLLHQDADATLVVAQGRHYLVPPTATVRDVVTGRRIAGPRPLLGDELREQLVGFFRDALGWDWDAEDPDEPAPIFGCDTRVPSSQTMLEELVDDLAPLIEAERQRVARAVVDAVLGKAVVMRDENGVEIASIDPADVALYAAERGLQ